MNAIAEIQNGKEQLDLLFVQRSLYSSAKRYFIWRTVFALILAIGGPILTSINTSYGVYIGLFAITYLILDNLCLEKIETSKKDCAAKVQELFDCKVLGLSWNDAVVGTQPEVELMASILIKNPNRDLSKLRDWYAPDVSRVDIVLGRFLCQRTNAWWDNTLRNKYLASLITAISVVVLLVIIYAISFGLSVANLILGIILPVLPLIEIIIKQIKDHREAYLLAKELQEKIDGTIKQIFSREDIPNPHLIARTYQDEIFRHRKKCPMVFDALYWIFRDHQEQQMNFSIQAKVASFLKQTNV